jgi:sugar phosphate permease
MSRTVYTLMFVTYALIHVVRTSWSYIKTYSHSDALDLSTRFFGELDMIILICLSMSIKTLGCIGERIGHKNFLLIGTSYLILTFMLIGILQIVGINQH